MKPRVLFTKIATEVETSFQCCALWLVVDLVPTASLAPNLKLI